MTEETKSSTKYVMLESSPSVDEDEIDLLELIRTLLQAWRAIVGITVVCVGLAIAYALNAPEVFKAETLLAPAQMKNQGHPLLSVSLVDWPRWREFPYPVIPMSSRQWQPWSHGSFSTLHRS